MNQSVPTMLIGGLIRVVQGFAEAAPTLLVGLLIASIMRYYLGSDGTRRLFGGDNLRSLPQSWLVGMLLPVCSIGVLPILFEMQRAKVNPGAMSAFALSAPLFNPLSLLYGLTLSRPLVIIFFVLGSLVVVTALGLFWDAFGRLRESTTQSSAPDESEKQKLIGLRRLLAILVHMSRQATGATLWTTLVALSGLAVLAAVLPYGAMQSSVECDDIWAPLKMLFVAVPVYATPMLAMSQLGMMFQHANSPGAAFALLILGAGMNFATPIWFGRHYGWRAASLWFSSLLLIVLSLSYAINKPLIPSGVEPAGHTHAFDIYTNPLSSHQGLSATAIGELISKGIDISAIVAFSVLGLVALMGIAFRFFKVDEESLYANAPPNALESSIHAQPDAIQPQRRFDLIVPSSVIGITMLIGLVVLCVVACFAYYPPASECFEEIRIARAECLSAANSGSIDHALFWLPVWEDWSRRMEVGTFLRSGRVRPYQRMQGYLLRKKLELLEHELEHDPFEPDETKKVVRDLMGTSTRWSRAFQP